jgi:hypothetical protein
MLTESGLVELYRDLKDAPVLSVYVDADQHDPAERDAWRRRLEREVADARRRAEIEGDDLAEFDAAWGHLRGELEPFNGFVPGRGWVGFATPASVRYAEAVPVTMPDLVRWEPGIRVAPYVRGLKQHRPVVLVLADRMRARVLIYRSGEIEEPEDLRADTDVGDLTDVGTHKRAYQTRDPAGLGTTSGVRGETATDQAQRIMEVESERMWKSLVRTMLRYADGDGLMVLGGTPDTVGRLAELVPEVARPRVLQRTALHLGLTLPELRDAAEQAAHELTERMLEGLVDEVVDRARSSGRAVLGREATEKALLGMRVDTLVLSRTFRAGAPDFADHCVGTALLQNARVEEASGTGGDRLDQEAGGIGARLRYRLPGEDGD